MVQVFLLKQLISSSWFTTMSISVLKLIETLNCNEEPLSVEVLLSLRTPISSLDLVTSVWAHTISLDRSCFHFNNLHSWMLLNLITKGLWNPFALSCIESSSFTLCELYAVSLLSFTHYHFENTCQNQCKLSWKSQLNWHNFEIL